MLTHCAVALALLAAAPPDEDEIPGHPDGEAPPLPAAVSWDLAKARTETTPRRKRITLDGQWRFAAVPERETPVLRSQMGWIEMPAPALRRDWRIRDEQFRSTAGAWRGKPLADFPWMWCEREIDTPFDWVNYQVFLVVGGPWSAAEVYVGYLPVDGLQRDDGKWFDLTEALMYGGGVPLCMRLKALADDATVRTTQPAVRLELMPSLPRFDDVHLRQDADRGELEITLDLRRTPFYIGLPVRLSEIPLIVQFELDDAAADRVIQRIDYSIGPMPVVTRQVVLRLPWPGEKKAPPESARLRSRLTSAYGGNLDAPFPIEFQPHKLPPAAN